MNATLTTAIDYEADAKAINVITRCGGDAERAKAWAVKQHAAHQEYDVVNGMFWSRVIDAIDRFGS